MSIPFMNRPNTSLEYTFKSLSEDEIRLIRLKPGTDKTPLECEIVHKRLHDSPAYEAISYVWADHHGNSSPCRQIYILPRFFLNIPKNCEAALQEFRSPTETKILWIDSICINQKSISEHSKQIPRMTDIYKSARRVLVYLGDGFGIPPEELEDLLSAIEKRNCNNKGLQCTRNHQHWTLENWFKDSGTYQVLASTNQASASCGKELEELSVLRKFLSFQWFSRIWVLQETIMATDIIASCARRRIKWFYLVLYSYQGFHPLQYVDSTITIEIPAVLRLGSELRLGEGIFTDLLLGTYKYGASDPRDKVFALLPFCKEAQASILPDYSKEAKEVFWQATQFCILHYQSLKVLTLLDHSFEGVPSWVPNLADENHRMPIGLCGYKSWMVGSAPSNNTQNTNEFGTSLDRHCPRIITLGEGTAASGIRVAGRQIDRVLMVFPLGQYMIEQCKMWADMDEKRFTLPNRLGNTPTLILRELLRLLKQNSVSSPWILSACQNVVKDRIAKQRLYQSHIIEGVDLLAPPQEILPTLPRSIDLESIELLAPELEYIKPPGWKPLYDEPRIPKKEDWKWLKWDNRCQKSFPIKQASNELTGPSHFNQKHLYSLVHLLARLGSGRQLLVTEHSIGVGPALTRVGDLVYNLQGSDVPFVLRQADRAYRTVGETLLGDASSHAYVEGCKCQACQPYYHRLKQRKDAAVEHLMLI